MKVHNDLEELLRDFSNHLDHKRRVSDDCLNKVLKDYVSLNSLALGKPEPLAKNKQTERVCEICNGKKLLAYWHKTGMGMKHCECINSKDASSR